MKKLILLSIMLIVGRMFADILPSNFVLSSLNRSSITLPSNRVVDIREGINGKLYFGTMFLQINAIQRYTPMDRSLV